MEWFGFWGTLTLISYSPPAMARDTPSTGMKITMHLLIYWWIYQCVYNLHSNCLEDQDAQMVFSKQHIKLELWTPWWSGWFSVRMIFKQASVNPIVAPEGFSCKCFQSSNLVKCEVAIWTPLWQKKCCFFSLGFFSEGHFGPGMLFWAGCERSGNLPAGAAGVLHVQMWIIILAQHSALLRDVYLGSQPCSMCPCCQPCTGSVLQGWQRTILPI